MNAQAIRKLAPSRSLDYREQGRKERKRERIASRPKAGICRIVGINRINRIGEPILPPSPVTRSHAMATLDPHATLGPGSAPFCRSVRLDTSVRPYTMPDCHSSLCRIVSRHSVALCHVTLCQNVTPGGRGSQLGSGIRIRIGQDDR